MIFQIRSVSLFLIFQAVQLRVMMIWTLFNKLGEALSLHLYAMEKDGDVIPEPLRIQDIKPESYETVVLIDVALF